MIEEVKAWQSRLLDAVYPIVYLDALVVKWPRPARRLAASFSAKRNTSVLTILSFQNIH